MVETDTGAFKMNERMNEVKLKAGRKWKFMMAPQDLVWFSESGPL